MSLGGSYATAGVEPATCLVSLDNLSRWEADVKSSSDSKFCRAASKGQASTPTTPAISQRITSWVDYAKVEFIHLYLGSSFKMSHRSAWLKSLVSFQVTTICFWPKHLQSLARAHFRACVKRLFISYCTAKQDLSTQKSEYWLWRISWCLD